MNSSTFRRLAKDHAILRNAELPPYYFFGQGPSSAANHDDLTQLTILLTGPQGTPYANGLWKLFLRIPQDYPKSPPKAYFKTKIWHPNVEESDGSVCLDTLKRDWQPKLTLRDILITISCLLINPNPDSALNAGAGKLLQEDWDQYFEHAKLMTNIHASIPSNMRQFADEARRRGEGLDNDDSEDEEENNQENDASLSPPPPVQPIPTIVRPILGKRPLGELPTPVEPPSDDEDEYNTTSCSAQNITANTPNLSTSMTNLSFASAPASTINLTDFNGFSRRSPMLTERIRGTNFATSGSGGDSYDSNNEQPKAKRICCDEGKENDSENDFARFAVQPKVMPGIGLGVKTGASSLPNSRKPSASGITGAKPKPRVGLRRL